MKRTYEFFVLFTQLFYIFKVIFLKNLKKTLKISIKSYCLMKDVIPKDTKGISDGVRPGASQSPAIQPERQRQTLLPSNSNHFVGSPLRLSGSPLVWLILG